MSWRESSGRESCNVCRKPVDLGAPLYVGEHTPSFWCLNCAASTLGLSPDGPVPKFRSAGDASTFDAAAVGAELRRRIMARRRNEPLPFDAKVAQAGGPS
jgi:hypothetical protein